MADYLLSLRAVKNVIPKDKYADNIMYSDIDRFDIWKDKI